MSGDIKAMVFTGSRVNNKNEQHQHAKCSVPTTLLSIINFYTDESRLTNNTMTQSPHYKFSISQLPQVITKNCESWKL